MRNRPEELVNKDPNENFELFLKLLGSYIKAEREKSGHTSAKILADILDVTESQYREYERGETDMRLSTFLKIFRGLNKNIEDIFKINILNDPNAELTQNLTADPTIGNQVKDQVKNLNGPQMANDLSPDDIKRITKIIIACYRPLKRTQILKSLNLAGKTANFVKLFNILIDNQWIAMTYPDQPNHRKKTYYTTEAGKKVLRIK